MFRDKFAGTAQVFGSRPDTFIMSIKTLKLCPAEQLSFFPHLLLWAHNMSLPGGSLAGMIDDRSLAVMGHSRGAKLAALHYAAGVESMNAQMRSKSTSPATASIKLAVLVDPVDSKNPSAISALASCDDAQLVVVGKLNPNWIASTAFLFGSGRGRGGRTFTEVLFCCIVLADHNLIFLTQQHHSRSFGSFVLCSLKTPVLHCQPVTCQLDFSHSSCLVVRSTTNHLNQGFMDVSAM